MPFPRGWVRRSGLVTLREVRRLRAQPFLLRAQFRREFGAEVLGLEDLPDLDFGFFAGHRVWTALDPFDRLLFRFALPQPESGDQFLRFGKRAVDDRTLAVREFHARTLGARMQPLAREHHAR